MGDLLINSQRIPVPLSYVRPRGWVIVSPLWWVLNIYFFKHEGHKVHKGKPKKNKKPLCTFMFENGLPVKR